jgi:Type I site-specific restriction-modification system, R (restriction) subunit and related helicases
MLTESEWQTRKLRIDKKLKGLSQRWQIVRYHEGLNTAELTCHAVEEYPTDNGPADYTLFVKGKLLGIIEAKKVTVDPQNVLEQAKRYAQGVPDGVGNWDGLRVPFLYATNGEIIWFLDVRDTKRISRQISNFHTPDALTEFFAKDRQTSLHWLLDTVPKTIEKSSYARSPNSFADDSRAGIPPAD